MAFGEKHPFDQRNAGVGFENFFTGIGDRRFGGAILVEVDEKIRFDQNLLIDAVDLFGIVGVVVAD
jgi:hypothetical protein